MAMLGLSPQAASQAVNAPLGGDLPIDLFPNDPERSPLELGPLAQRGSASRRAE
jgi:hypothetical protein